ncbi:hypothetical protein [Porphyrobacter sp. CACIAM 03H1]|uniref:hypothetical protein n=1 Tax=Porphyrobacter sp. CACIAM 03H1 TaxID=2003315 RepID=UPI000B5AADF4|nr:hypothetical protein [Porphyrobacter sp. CACIAM 03H1]ASJ91946.1 hypothetical protein CBR61_14110 [Porphyrobacter sp. CACIAM 03H1]
MVSLRIALLALAGFCSAPGWAAAQEVKMSSDVFDLSSARKYEFRDVAGRPALCLDGVALLRGLSINDGSVTVDVAASRDRQFGGIAFRAQDALSYEEAYLRLHKSRQPDAVQYAPVLNGEGHWQLFGGHQISVDFGSYDWITLRVEFALDRATVTVFGADEAELRINDLVLDETGKRAGLSSIGGACFSNLRVSDQSSYPRERLAAPADAQTGTISEWVLSPASNFAGFPARAPEQASDWTPARTERDGLLLISRYRTKQVKEGGGSNSETVVYAATTVQSPEDTLAVVEFDASDKARVYLNGGPLAEFDNTFRAKGPTFRGDFGAERQRVFLPLKAGDNEFVLAVADSGNGWGLKARMISDVPPQSRASETTVRVKN